VRWNNPKGSQFRIGDPPPPVPWRRKQKQRSKRVEVASKQKVRARSPKIVGEIETINDTQERVEVAVGSCIIRR
jgi:hypothetical protein